MKYNAVLFDLDGTLLDTLEDIADSVNLMLAAFSFPPRSYDEIRRFVGNGARTLVAKSVPSDTPAELIDDCLNKYLSIYSKNLRNKTRPYDGVLNLLARLKASGIQIGVLSNKGESNVKELCQDYFGGLVDVAAGEIPGIPRKPAPDGVLRALNALGSSPRHTAYVGDSETDVRTAQNAGLSFIGVSWGFRHRSDLLTEGAELIADSLEELSSLLLPK